MPSGYLSRLNRPAVFVAGRALCAWALARSLGETHASAPRAVTVATVTAPASAVMTVPRNDVRAADRDTEHSTNYGPGRSCNHGSQACADASALQRTCLRYEGHQRQQ